MNFLRCFKARFGSLSLRKRFGVRTLFGSVSSAKDLVMLSNEDEHSRSPLLPHPSPEICPYHDHDDSFTIPHLPTCPLLIPLPLSPLIMPLEMPSESMVVMEHELDPFHDQEDWSFDSTDTNNLPQGDTPMTDDDDCSSPRRSIPSSALTQAEFINATASGDWDKPSKANIFDWSEQPMVDKDSRQGSSPRPKTVHGIKSRDTRTSRLSGRRGSNAIHLRSQSVPLPPDTSGHRSHNNASKLESWVLGNKGVSEDWDGDFDFEESPRPAKQVVVESDGLRSSMSSGMVVPRAIMEQQASVRGQFGHVKELTLLVEELKRLQQQASHQGIMHGQSVELWKEAEGIINLATVDDEEEDLLPPRSPHSVNHDFDLFDEDSPSSHGRRKSYFASPKEIWPLVVDDGTPPLPASRALLDSSQLSTPPRSRPRKESTAQAKSVLETIHHQRNPHTPDFRDSKSSQKKLPFDTNSLRDLVTRAGVLTRALKEIVRRAENPPSTPKHQPATPPRDPLFSQIFQNPPSSPSVRGSPRIPQSPKPTSFRGGSIASNDNEINGHMKMMAVV